eukprot:4438720-Pyramimonas_sp.AAC.1
MRAGSPWRLGPRADAHSPPWTSSPAGPLGAPSSRPSSRCMPGSAREPSARSASNAGAPAPRRTGPR